MGSPTEHWDGVMSRTRFHLCRIDLSFFSLICDYVYAFNALAW
jgi:hypothetical protein